MALRGPRQDIAAVDLQPLDLPLALPLAVFDEAPKLLLDWRDKPKGRQSQRMATKQRPPVAPQAALIPANLTDKRISDGIERIRLRLRPAGRKIPGGGSAVDNLPTLPGVNIIGGATRYIEGGRERFIEFVQLAVLNEQPAALSWWMVYRDLTPAERERVSYDDICAAAQVRPSKFIAAVMEAAVEFGNDIGNLVAAVSHPSVVKQAVKSAKRIGGQYAQVAQRDRHALMEHAGMLPQKQGGVNVNVNATAESRSASMSEAQPSSFADGMNRIALAKRAVQHTIAAETVEARALADAREIEINRSFQDDDV